MTKFKVGDWARIKGRKEVRQIIEIQRGEAVFDKKETLLYPFEQLELVCGFKKGEIVLAFDDTGDSATVKFVQYYPNSITPYLCECVDTTLVAWEHAKPIPEKKYKPYLKFDSNWKGKKVKSKDFDRVLKIIGTHYSYNDRERLICGIDEENSIFIFSNKQMLNDYTWLDGSVCGEEMSC
jgi:hypothetical protein